MDQSSQSFDRSYRVTAPFGATLAATFALVPGMLMAQTPAGTPHESVSASVSLADLDITTVEGTRAAQDRLKAMAQRLCRKFWDERKVSASETYFECTRDTFASALAQLKATAPGLQLAKEASRPSVHSD